MKFMQAIYVAGALAAAVTAHAQQTTQNPTPVTAASPADISVTHRGADAAAYVTVKAASANVRDVLRDMAARSGVKVMFSPSVTGTITGSVSDQPIDAAMTGVAAMAGMSVRKISLASADADKLTPDAAATIFEALSLVPVNAVVTDTASGKAFTVSQKAGASTGTDTDIYYVQGKLSPAQERAADLKRAAAKAAKATGTPEAVAADTTSAMAQLTPAQRAQAMMQIQQSMTPEDRQAMRQVMMQQYGGQGGGGGFRRNRGGGNGQ